MDFKSALKNYYKDKKLTKKQMSILKDIQDKEYKSVTVSKTKIIHWSLTAVAISLLIAYLWQLNDQKSMANYFKSDDVLTKSLILSYIKNIEPDIQTNSLNDIVNHFKALEFKPIDPSNYLPIKSGNIIGASYVLLGDSIGIYMLFKDPVSNKRYSIIQKPVSNNDLFRYNKSLKYNKKNIISNGKYIKIRMLSENGVLTAIAW